MKKMQMFVAAIAFLVISGCSGEEKKVLVMASGKVQISDNIITLEPGTTHTENEISVTGDKLTVKSPSGSNDFTVTESGLYILNLKNDTLVGSYQRIGSDNSQQVISQEDLKKRVDSLNQLISGNASTASKNFSIAPNQIAKITTNTGAEIIGPYKRMPASFESGKEHEIYKFYTNKEMYEIMDKLKKMMSDSSQLAD